MQSDQVISSRTHEKSCASNFTARELQVAERLLQGETSKEIAVRLGISQRTVESYRARLRVKTGARRGQLLARLAAVSIRSHGPIPSATEALGE